MEDGPARMVHMVGGHCVNVAVIGAALTSVAMKRGDDSRRDRAAKAKGIAYGDHPIADARRGAVPDFDERQATGIDLQNREIGCDITTDQLRLIVLTIRTEEQTSELKPLMRISYAVICLKK